jgi:hypothetical protein
VLASDNEPDSSTRRKRPPTLFAPLLTVPTEQTTQRAGHQTPSSMSQHDSGKAFHPTCDLYVTAKTPSLGAAQARFYFQSQSQRGWL